MSNSTNAVTSARSIVAYDLETSGLNPQFDQVFQIAAVRTDQSLEMPDGDVSTLLLRAKRQPWIVPSPAAMLITRMGPENVEAGLLHHKMMEQVEKFFAQEPAIFMSYNGLRFDENVLRNSLYRSLCRPYLTNSGSSTRADLMRMAQAIAVLDPGVLTVPFGENGRPTFRLGSICHANHIQLAEDEAHDALADVKATLALGRLLKERARTLFEHLLLLAEKSTAESILMPGTAVFRLATILGKPVVRALGVLGSNRTDKNSRVCVDLTVDPGQYLDLPSDRLSAWAAQRPSPIVPLRTNCQELVFPVRESLFVSQLRPHLRIMNSETADPPTEILAERAAMIAADEPFVTRIHAIVAEQHSSRMSSPHVEAQLRDAFPPESDYRAAYIARDLDPELRGFAGNFKDPRLRELSARIQYETEPERLPIWAREAHEQWVAERLLSTSPMPWRTIADAREEIAQLMQRRPKDAARLARISNWVDAMEAGHLNKLRP